MAEAVLTTVRFTCPSCGFESDRSLGTRTQILEGDITLCHNCVAINVVTEDFNLRVARHADIARLDEHTKEYLRKLIMMILTANCTRKN